jgi:signal transduction histidine kinase/CheY-like chemotaxis protein
MAVASLLSRLGASPVLSRLAVYAASVSGMRYAVRPSTLVFHSEHDRQGGRHADLRRVAGPSPRWAAVLAADRTTLRSHTILLWALIANGASWTALFAYLGPAVIGPGFAVCRTGNGVSAVVFFVWSVLKVLSWRAFVRWSTAQHRLDPHRGDGGEKAAAFWWDTAALVNSPSLTVNVLLVWILFSLTTANLALGASTPLQFGTIGVPLYAALTEGGASFLRWTGVVVALYVLVSLGVVNFADELGDYVPSQEVQSTMSVILSLWGLVFVVLFQELFSKRLREAEQQAHEWSRALQFDLRTPLHALIGAAEQLVTMRISVPDPADCPEREILSLAETARTLFENAAQDKFQHLHQRPSNPVAVALVDVCASINTTLTAIARKHRHTTLLTLNEVPLRSISRDASPIVQLDSLEEADVLQCVVNLISNAAKFTPDAGQICVRVKVTTRTPDGSPGFLIFKVEDTGPGVPPEMRERIFGRYTRGTGTKTTQGVGLGLSVVHAVLRRSGGSVLCKNRRSGPGAKFVIRIPCRVVGALPPHQKSTPSQTGGVAPFVGDVCIVDDNAMNLRILRQLLKRAGVPDDSVSTFTSAEAVLEHVAENGAHFDVAFLDCVLPGMDGVELTSRLLQLHNDKLRVFGVSASASSDEFFGAGARGFFRKPFSLGQIRQALSSGADLSASDPPQADNRSHSSPTTLPSSPEQPFRPVVVDQMRIGGFVALGGLGLCVALGFWSLALVNLILGCILAAAGSTARVAGWDSTSLVFASCTVFFTVLSILMGCSSREMMIPLALGAQYMPRRQVWLALCFVAEGLPWALRVLDPERSGICAERVAWSRDELIMIDISSMVCVLAMFVVQLSLVGSSLERQEWFTHTLSHDIRAPLHGIFALLDDVEKSPAREKHIPAIESMAVVLSSTVDTVLLLDDDKSVAGVRSAKSRLSPVPISELARFVETQLSLVLEQKCDTSGLFGHDVVVEVPRSEVQFVFARVVMFAPLQRRISGVAAKFYVDQRSCRLTLELSGTSISTSREQCGGDGQTGSLTEKVESSLLLAKELARFSGSALEVDEQASGTWTLRLTLAVHNISKSRKAAASAFPQVSRVVVVDDNRLHRQIAARFCEQLGLEDVRLFDSAENFCKSDLAEPQSGIHLFLVDLHMPGIAGPASWRERCPEMFNGAGRVALACSGDASAAMQCHEAGFRGCLCKPFSLDDLRQSISSALESVSS